MTHGTSGGSGRRNREAAPATMRALASGHYRPQGRQ